MLKTEELRHLRGAQGHMYRIPGGKGRIVVNPNPDMKGARVAARQWNASIRTVESLKARGFLEENDRGDITNTDAGLAEIAKAQKPVTVRQVA